CGRGCCGSSGPCGGGGKCDTLHVVEHRGGHASFAGARFCDRGRRCCGSSQIPFLETRGRGLCCCPSHQAPDGRFRSTSRFRDHTHVCVRDLVEKRQTGTSRRGWLPVLVGQTSPFDVRQRLCQR